MNIRPALASASTALMLALASCSGPSATATLSAPPPPGSVGVIDTLPPGWNQPYYYYNSRFYYGGKWETGTFEHNGHTFPNRYAYNGTYFYGGRYNDGKVRQFKGVTKKPAKHKESRPHLSDIKDAVRS